MINGYKSFREKERAERATAEGRNPHALGRPVRVSKEEKVAKRRAKEARYRANPEWKAKKYAAKNKSRRLAYAAKAIAEGRTLRKWRLADEERKLARRMAANNWREKNKDYDAVRSRNRRALKKGAGGTHTKADIVQLYFLQKGKCAWCKASLGSEPTHVDHWMPLSKGGSNDPSNLRLLHKTCNLRKYNKIPEDMGLCINTRSKHYGILR